jgi:hypothetical protein
MQFALLARSRTALASAPTADAMAVIQQMHADAVEIEDLCLAGGLTIGLIDVQGPHGTRKSPNRNCHAAKSAGEHPRSTLRAYRSRRTKGPLKPVAHFAAIGRLP